MVDRIAARELDPYTAANELLRRALQSPDQSRDSMRNQLPDHPITAITRSMKAVLDHVGIAVEDLPAALAFYRDALGLEIEAPEEVASQRVRAHFVPVGDSKLELLEAHRARLGDREVRRRSAAPGCITSRCASTTSTRRSRS